MLFPAGTGSGASVLEMARTGAEVTVVVIAAPDRGAVSLGTRVEVGVVIIVPLASGFATWTVSVRVMVAPAFRAPMFQVTMPAASVPPPVAETNEVFPGTVSVITTPVASALPVFEYDSV